MPIIHISAKYIENKKKKIPCTDTIMNTLSTKKYKAKSLKLKIDTRRDYDYFHGIQHMCFNIALSNSRTTDLVYETTSTLFYLLMNMTQTIKQSDHTLSQFVARTAYDGTLLSTKSFYFSMFFIVRNMNLSLLTIIFVLYFYFFLKRALFACFNKWTKQNLLSFDKTAMQ